MMTTSLLLYGYRNSPSASLSRSRAGKVLYRYNIGLTEV